MRGRSRMRLAALLALGMLAAAATRAQEDAAPDTGPDTTAAPRAAEHVEGAARALLLDVVAVRDGFVAVGAHGIILRSGDAHTWEQVGSPVSVTLTRARFADGVHGWAVGYDGCLLASPDAGRHWRIARYDPGWGRPWFDVLFTDAEHGLLAGANGMLRRSGDGGRTWDVVDDPALQDAGNLYAFVRAGAHRLLLAGEAGFLARSEDDGAHWTRLASPYAGSLFGALALSDDAVLVYGMRGNAFVAAHVSRLPAAPAVSAGGGGGSQAPPLYSSVEGWTRAASDDHESLFGGMRSEDGHVVLAGANGHLLRYEPSAPSLRPLAVSAPMSVAAGVFAGDALVLAGTGGVVRLSPP